MYDTWAFQWPISQAQTFPGTFILPLNLLRMESTVAVCSCWSYTPYILTPPIDSDYNQINFLLCMQVKCWFTAWWAFHGRQRARSLIWWSIRKCRQRMPFAPYECVVTFDRTTVSCSSWPTSTMNWEERGNTHIDFRFLVCKYVYVRYFYFSISRYFYVYYKSS